MMHSFAGLNLTCISFIICIMRSDHWWLSLAFSKFPFDIVMYQRHVNWLLLTFSRFQFDNAEISSTLPKFLILFCLNKTKRILFMTHVWLSNMKEQAFPIIPCNLHYICTCISWWCIWLASYTLDDMRHLLDVLRTFCQVNGLIVSMDKTKMVAI